MIVPGIRSIRSNQAVTKIDAALSKGPELP